MRPVSAAFLAALRGSHRMVADARIVTTFQSGVDPDGTDIPIFEGDVSADASADVRATLQMTTDGTRAWSTHATGLLTPYGNEVFVRRGLDFGNGIIEWVSQGYFRIIQVEQSDRLNGPIRLSASDRMQGIIEARLTEPIQFPASVILGDIFAQLVGEVYPDVVIEWDDATENEFLSRSQIAEEDRYTFLRDLATSYSKIMYFDYRGVLVIKTPPDPSVSVYDVNTGAGGVLVSLSRSLGREGVYNAVVVNGEGADNIEPVHAVVFDNNPSSPTYWFGRFGKVPRFFSSSFITNNLQAGATAQSLLQQAIGLPYNVNFATIPNPALEPLDPIEVSTPEGHVLHIIEALVTPLIASSAMTATTRQQPITTIFG